MKSATRSASSPLFSSPAAGAPPVGGISKRSFDILVALAALVLLSPIFVLVMALVKYSDGGSIFYGHRRIGYNGSTFRCLKFRTMAENGDALLQEYLEQNPAAYEEWRNTRKLQYDPRITVVGTVLRKLSLDELRWGLIPDWAEGDARKACTTNAPTEGLDRDKAYSGPWWRSATTCESAAMTGWSRLSRS